MKNNFKDFKTKQYLQEVEYYKKILTKDSKEADIDSLMLKVYRQINFKTPEEVQKTIEKINTQLINRGIDACEDEILALFYKITKYSNFDEILKFSDCLKKNCFDYIVNLNPALSYLQFKGVFDLEGDIKAVFLDDFFFNHTNKEKAQKIINSPVAKFVLPTGWNSGATIFDSQNFDGSFVDNFVEIFINAKKIQQDSVSSSKITFDSALDKALNAKTFEKAKKLGISCDDVFIVNSKTPKNLTLEKIIAHNLIPNHITKTQFEKSIRTISKQFFGTPKLQKQAQKLLLKYYCDNLRVFSSSTFNQNLIEMHNEILKIAKKDENVIYVTPTPDDYLGIPKSDKYTTNIYLKVNNIKNAKIISHYGWSRERRNLEKGKTYVMLDDYSGSGSTLACFFPPPDLNGAKIIYAPVFICEQAQKYVERNLIKKRNDEIFLIKGDKQGNKLFYDYIKNLASDEQEILKKIFYRRKKILNEDDISEIDKTTQQELNGNYLSYRNSFSCVCLPHMAPDNNSYINANVIIPYFAPCADSVKNYTLNDFYENCRQNSRVLPKTCS